MGQLKHPYVITLEAVGEVATEGTLLKEESRWVSFITILEGVDVGYWSW